MRHKLFALLAVLVAAVSTLIAMRPVPAADGELLDAVRNDDARTVQKALASGIDPNEPDDTGAFALMYASALASPQVLRALIQARADVNASSRNGATALMWAAGDIAKVRLLLDGGAAVNARDERRHHGARDRRPARQPRRHAAAARSGVAHLVRTQLENGTWFVRSRAFGFQPYFESGFPHGVDQFISASATAWAVIALARAL